ncbi:MAG: CvpA family protein [Thermodesulfobacteriota bacterium]|nr:CvpA family protein [Thermodesulfobacteriota bacterium]
MEPLTFFFIGIVGYCTFRGILIGFLRQCFSFIAILAGIFIGAENYSIVGDVLPPKVFVGGSNNIFGFIIVFLVIFFILTIVGALLVKALKAVHLGKMDNKLSGILGFIKGMFIVLSLTVIFIALSATGSPVIKRNSYLIKLIPHTKIVTFLLPGEVFAKFEKNKKIYLRYWKGEEEAEEEN